jgi:hypothetical protein
VRKVGRLAYKLDFLANYKIYLIVSVVHLSSTLQEEDPFGRVEPPPGLVEDS